MQNQIWLVKEEIINVKYAIQWAKLNVINTFLLNEKEIFEIDKIFKESNMPLLSIEEMLEFSDVTILNNKTTILYIIKVPNLEKTIYENTLIKPIIKKNTIVNIKFQEIFFNNGNMFGIKSKCKTYHKIKICNKNNIVNISNSTCLPKILIGVQQCRPHRNNRGNKQRSYNG